MIFPMSSFLASAIVMISHLLTIIMVSIATTLNLCEPMTFITAMASDNANKALIVNCLGIKNITPFQRIVNGMII